jgi:predicted ATPase
MRLDFLGVSNFKCFRELRLPLGALTIVTGYNAAGKSTAIQGLLLLAQASRQRETGRAVPLNGPIVRLGSSGDVVAASSEAKSLQLEVGAGDVSVGWTLVPAQTGLGLLEVEKADARYGSTRSSWGGSVWPETADGSHLQELYDAIRQTVVLSAVRAGPADTFPVPDDGALLNADVGLNGEFAPWWHAQMADYEIPLEKRHPLETGTSFRRQLDAYLGELFPSAQVNVEQIARASLVRLEFKTSTTGDWRRPANTGYGLTYAFPILVALLAAEKNQIVFIDSPEAHLHPRAQSMMGRQLARFANAGVQVIVETHSDHIINGIRLGAREKLVSSGEVAVYFFRGATPEAHNVDGLNMDVNGAIDNWPEGFFDQSEHDLASLAGWL